MSHEPCAMGDVPFLTYLFFVLGLQSALHGHGSKDTPRMGTSPSHQKSIYLDKLYPLKIYLDLLGLGQLSQDISG